MNKYVGVELVAVTVRFDLVVEDGETVGGVMEMMIDLFDGRNRAQRGQLDWELVQEFGPGSGHPVVQVSGTVEDVEAFLGVNDFQMEW